MTTPQRRLAWFVAGAAAAAAASWASSAWERRRRSKVTVSSGLEMMVLPDVIPALVVSLVRHQYRRQRLAAQAQGVQFSPAVDGSKLRHWVDGLTRGELACFYSHVGMWLRIAMGSDDVVLVLEDDADVRLPEQWDDIRAAAQVAPDGWDVLYLGHDRHGPPGIRRVPGDIRGSHAMLLTKRAACKLLEAYGETDGRDSETGKSLPVDVWVSRQQQRAGLRAYCVFPAMVYPFDPQDSEVRRTV